MHLLAFGWANPWMLGWLAAAALPLLVHLLRRRRYDEVPWAAMRWLRVAVEHETRRLRLEHWTLLALRTLLIVLVVLAAAGPVFGPQAPANDAAKTLRLLILDGSYSMGYVRDGTSRFAAAKAIAQQIVHSGKATDEWLLMLMADTPIVPLDWPTTDRDATSQRIDELALSQTGANLAFALDQAYQLIDAMSVDFPRAEVVVISDLQAETWSPRSPVFRIDVREQLKAIASKATLQIIDVGLPSADNRAVSRLRTEEPLAIVGRDSQIQATVANFGPAPQQQQAVEFWIDGRRVAQQAVDIAAGESATVAFPHRFEVERDYAVEVRAKGDRLEIDNRRLLVVRPRKQLHILCIEGRPSARPFQGAADYLALALSPSRQSGSDLLHVEKAQPDDLLLRDLRGVDCIFFCDVGRFTAAQAQRLNAYLRDGGNVVFFLGDHVDTANYQAVLGIADGQSPQANRDGPSRHEGLHLLPARLEKLITGESQRIDPLGFTHPMLEPFRRGEAAALILTPVWKYFRLAVPLTGLTKTVLALSNGDPLLVEQPVHRGRVLIVATSADPQWSALPLVPQFVPLVRTIALWCVGNRPTVHAATVGESLGQLFPTLPATARIETPDGRVQSLASPSGKSPSIARQSGIYSTVGDAASTDRVRVAVNLDTAESNLAKIDADTLHTQLPPNVSVSTAAQRDATLPAALSNSRHESPSRPVAMLLIAALAVALIETFIAWRFSVHRTSARPLTI